MILASSLKTLNKFNYQSQIFFPLNMFGKYLLVNKVNKNDTGLRSMEIALQSIWLNQKMCLHIEMVVFKQKRTPSRVWHVLMLEKGTSANLQTSIYRIFPASLDPTNGAFRETFHGLVLKTLKTTLIGLVPLILI